MPKVHPEDDAVDDRGEERTDEGAPLKRPAVDGEPWVTILDAGDGVTSSTTVRIRTGHTANPCKTYQVCTHSLCFIPISWRFRRLVLSLIEWRWFDRFILLNIAVISLLSASYQWRAPEDEGFNKVVTQIVEPIINGFFTVEFVLKAIGWGFICHRGAYLRNPWNWLDFVVVVDANVQYLPFFDTGGLNFLRLFRALRPLRSLNAVPQMKVLVNTVIVSIPKLGHVTLMGVFLYFVFGIAGMTLMEGVFYRRCRLTPNPTFNDVTNCWAWEYSEDDRLCGGRHVCATGTHCGGHTEDPNDSLRPNFGAGGMGDFPWCVGSEPKKLNPETDFIHFDHIGGAVLVVFQCMTLEGWTDIMYWVQDSYNEVLATIFFCIMICITSHFLLNVALAVVDEVRDNFAEEEGIHELPVSESSPDVTGKPEEEELWIDCRCVRFLHNIATSELFLNLILFFIIANVITMMLEKYPPEVSWKDFIHTAEITFLAVFCVEMAIMLGAYGPWKYATNPVTAFDGVIVIVSVVQEGIGESGPLTALRTLRLFRVLNKLQDRWHSLKVLLKAMLHTGMALNYWLVLFMLMLYILTLMAQSFLNRKFHFTDPDAFDARIEGNAAWCPDVDSLPPGQRSWHYWQDCIPRAHFDTFLWAFVTIFQIMTGENWNTVMYAGMRATSWVITIFFWFLILFGQTLFLSLFLSILTSKFQEVNNQIAAAQAAKIALKPKRKSFIQQIRASSSNLLKGQSNKKLSVTSTRSNLSSTWPSRVDVKPRNGEKIALPGQLEGTAQEEDESSELQEAKVTPLAMPEYSSDELAGQSRSFGLGLFGERFAKASRDRWPFGYAWFVLSEKNPVRKAARWILSKEVIVRGDSIKVFDNVILLCILLSTVCMMIDFPLRDPQDTLTKVVRTADTVFAIIFCVEMAVKLVACGLIWGHDAYLKSGWNWLDGIVVIVSIMGMASASSGGFLKTLRILRAFRPLRVISRNKNLKVVVETIFGSVPYLATLGVVSTLFLLIFALVCLSYLKGRFYQCPAPDSGQMPALLRDIRDLRTPLCVPDTSPSAANPISTANGAVASQSGAWNVTTNLWDSGTCTAGTHLWQRATVDTPICIGRCDPTESALEQPPSWLCPQRFSTTEELPPVGTCRTLRPLSAAEQRGVAFTEAMQRALVMPCGGSTVVSGQVVPGAGASASCRSLFCPQGAASNEVRDSCRANCRKEPEFCVQACESSDLNGNDGNLDPGCSSCLLECEAACQCRDFCEPLIKDAALCHEQGQAWSQTLSQNFDNIWSSMLTLFEISTTEGWVDVMYSATDAMDTYVQPKRDNQQWVWAPFFVFYIFFMTMFLINLSVGIIVERFFELGKTQKENNHGRKIMMTEAQAKWVKSQMTLYTFATCFRVTNLHLLPRLRRKVFNVVDHINFERAILVAIVINTTLMSLKIFPPPWKWWEPLLVSLNSFFLLVFLLEAALKIFALRWSYFKDNWNRYDFFCVVLGVCTAALKTFGNVDVVAISGVVRIFRVARLFKIVRRLNQVNKIFMALILSLPKLANVIAILLLVLTLYGILGVSLFSTAKKPADGTLDNHGNFDDFWKAFVTLFRSSTGEAWNELMHDLSKDERMFYREGDWCSPADLFDTSMKYEVLKDKCLTEQPNACVQDIFGSNVLPVIYWVSYILVCLHLMMNLVIAVILDGYEEGKDTPPEQKHMELCIEKWKEYDPDLTLKLPLPKAMHYIGEVYTTVKSAKEEELRFLDSAEDAERHRGGRYGVDLAHIPMSSAKCWNLVVLPDGQVTFTSATKQALRLIVSGGREDSLADLEASAGLLDKKTAAVLHGLETQAGGADQEEGADLRLVIAASKIQGNFRARRKRRREEREREAVVRPATEPQPLECEPEPAVSKEATSGAASPGQAASSQMCER
eukprot:CAMPEP_0168363876 /NCGR_PEP_ID=MMETSP0228-20121227/3920_1 /TAXON_ID=133427 /ORGANISM="Protoceratium reticulatum, Strain CCCM 535 (=CCMP 1889)" /LENGTH=1902 /DNA_ID=CAMNT_0008376623 /DNA_START=137 /DNA_END=5845 /DNA_ORIENTATION=+